MESYSFKNVDFTYPEGEKKALRNISFTVQQGEFVILCGPSGCGKSTLLRHLKSCLTPHGLFSGEIRYQGKLLAEMSQREQAQQIGYVLQSPENQVVTDKVWHELAFGLESLGYDTPTIRRRVAEIAAFFGIENWFYKNVTELSGGQKQLLSLASVMAMQPGVLVLDEPTSGLDPLMQKEFFDILKERNDKGTTIFLSSHVLWEVQNYCKRAAIIREGRSIACDNIEALAKTNAKRVTVVGDVSLEGLDGVKDERKELDKLSFLYSGDMNDLISYISKYKIKDISIMEPDLEEIFMHYYKEEEK